MTLEAVRAAALALDPYEEMDQLVRAELSAGRSVRQITKAYLPILDAALETPGLTEDGEEALRGTLDALTGDCHKDCQYRDPPNPQLPSEEEIAELPRWARVAFAARCARRVLPLYSVADTARWKKHSRVLLDVLDLADDVSDSAKLSPTLAKLKEDVNHIGVAGWTNSDDLTVNPDTLPSYWLVRAIWHVIHTVETNKFTTCFTSVSSDVSAMRAADAFGFAIAPHIRRDFDHLAQLAEVRRWTDDTPVPPDVFGPLWPEGPPKGWPANTDAPARDELVIEAYASDKATEKKIEDDLVNLFNALNRYNIARSGKRLMLRQFRSLVSSHALVEV